MFASLLFRFVVVFSSINTLLTPICSLATPVSPHLLPSHSSPGNTSSNLNTSHALVGPVTGGITGGICTIALVVSVCYVLSSRRKRRRCEYRDNIKVSPFHERSVWGTAPHTQTHRKRDSENRYIIEPNQLPSTTSYFRAQPPRVSPGTGPSRRQVLLLDSSVEESGAIIDPPPRYIE